MRRPVAIHFSLSSSFLHLPIRHCSPSIMVKGDGSWDLNRIRAKGYTDNVADLMVGKLTRLPVETQKALQLLACMGNSAEFAVLRLFYQDSNEEMHAQLWEGVRAGLIFRSEDSYRFPPRSCPGSSLLVDPGGITRGSTSPNRKTALRAHPSREEGGQNL